MNIAAAPNGIDIGARAVFAHVFLISGAASCGALRLLLRSGLHDQFGDADRRALFDCFRFHHG
jgi:hypothetical protein